MRAKKDISIFFFSPIRLQEASFKQLENCDGTSAVS
jgi:hypothetical protein